MVNNRQSFTEDVAPSLLSEEGGSPKIALLSSNESPRNLTQDLRLGLQQLQPFLKIAVPFFQSDSTARNSLALVSALTFVNSAVSVGFSYITRDFYNALNSHNEPAFYEKMQLFFLALLVAVPLSVTYSFTLDKLSLYWREALTKAMLSQYYAQQRFYVIETLREIDNPDQRITEDIRHFTKTSLGFFITLLTSAVDLVSFSFVLFQIFPNLFLGIILYAIFGTIVTTQLGQSLVALNYEKVVSEADFRFQLFRVRENAESIAFYDRDLKEEQGLLTSTFQRALSTTLSIITLQRNIDTFTTSYRYIIQILPSLIIAPLYFQGKVELGVINQSYSAFNHILSDFSIIINSFESLSFFAAGLTRLSTFLDRISSDTPWGQGKPLIDLQVLPLTSPTSSEEREEVLRCRNVTVFTPDFQRVVIGNLSHATPSEGMRGVDFTLHRGDQVLIVGASGAGKSSFVRAIAGLWQVGYGQVTWDASLNDVMVTPSNTSSVTSGLLTAPRRVFFLPQKPYNVIGSLRTQLTYPNLLTGGVEGGEEEVRDEVLLSLLERVQLGSLAQRIGGGDVSEGLRAEKDWSRVLSIGEQQRLAFARVLFNRPDVVVLDGKSLSLSISYRLTSSLLCY